MRTAVASSRPARPPFPPPLASVRPPVTLFRPTFGGVEQAACVHHNSQVQSFLKDLGLRIHVSCHVVSLYAPALEEILNVQPE
jgi:hypothetical protein